MDSMPVNWEALDALVIDFAKSERLIDDSSPPPSSSAYRWRLLVSQIRRFLESGDIDSAIDLLRAYAPALLDDHRLLFRLQKQACSFANCFQLYKFIELLRKGTNEDRDSAIQCVRTSLAPCALDAYPEAYEEFKHALLALIYDKDDQTSPVVNEWSERRRFEIAGLLSSVLRAHLHAYDPIFSMTLRYLISIHKGFCLHQGVSSPISDLTERLLLEERDPPATPQESLFEAPPFDEVDIQALAHAVELTRQDAIDSLRFAKGDLHLAFQVNMLQLRWWCEKYYVMLTLDHDFLTMYILPVNMGLNAITCFDALTSVYCPQNELCRMRLDTSVFDELVHEYCIYRGIVDSGLMNSGLHITSGMSNVDQLDPGSTLSENCSTGSDSDMSVGSAHMEGSQSKTELLSTHNADIEVRYPCETTSFNENCSTSRTRQPEDGKVVQRNRCRGTGERGKRKRWMERNEDLETVSEVLSERCKHELSATNLLGCTNFDFKKSSMTYNVSSKADKYEIVLGIKELASEGMAAEVEFFKLVHAGDHSCALKVASSHLGPLAAKDPALLKPMKETLLALLRSTEEPIGKHFSLDVLATSLQVAVGRRLGIEEPQLMKIIRATLHTHSEWFKLQMCKDQFEGLLWINSLKELGSRLLGDAATRSTIDTCTQGSSPVTISSTNMRMQEDGSSPNQISSSDIGCDENAILKVMETTRASYDKDVELHKILLSDLTFCLMDICGIGMFSGYGIEYFSIEEFLALPRADAIHLLAQYNGNAETVIQQIFA
ncbi:hypothetical protein DH2020_050045 [Rehmannia glutinosa]|uniref:CTLH domain-containing protein n=1 Tax=Rehmannia glutinosa TaxID=99300 RepID=A0ABR0U1P7_REHGL